jgi:seryl-tRNA synthetase
MTRKHETETPAEQTETVTDLDRIKQLEEQKRALDAQLKTAKASMNPLDRVIAEQAGHQGNPLLLGKVKGRVKAGQDKDEAINAVLELAREWLQAALAGVEAE